MLDPNNKKDTPCPNTKVKPQQDGRRGEIAFKIKTYTGQRGSEGSNKPVHTRTRRSHRDRARAVSERLLRRYGQQWPAAGAGALGAADLGVA